MKKIKSLRLASILLIGTLLTTCLLGGTFAKYTAEASGSSTAQVAKWSFWANKQEIAVSPQATYGFDLFETVNDADGTSTEEDVSNGKIAPGTGGSFKMTVQNMAEVSTKYSIALTATNNSNVPIQYSLNGTDWTDSISQLATDNLSNQELEANSTVKAHTLYWRWAFDENTENALTSQSDEADSKLGHPSSNQVAEVVVTATITASQVD